MRKFNKVTKEKKHLIFKTSLGKALVLSFLTLGIYSFIWFYKIVVSMNLITKNNTNDVIKEYLLCLFVPFYIIYWFYSYEKKFFIVRKTLYETKENTELFLALPLVGLLFIVFLIVQSEINYFTRYHNDDLDISEEKNKIIYEDSILKWILFTALTFGLYSLFINRSTGENQFIDFVVFSLLILFVISLLLFIIHTFMWLYKIVKSINIITKNRTNDVIKEYLLCIFIPLYIFYWIYSNEKKFFIERKKYYKTRDNAILYLLVPFYGTFLYVFLILQSEINYFAESQNYKKTIHKPLIKINLTRKAREALFGYIFVLLWIVGFLVFTFYPMFYSFYLSLHTAYYSLSEGVTTTYIGFTNYLNIFRSQTLLPLYRDYVARMFISVPLIVVFSIMIAILINNPIKLKGIWRTIFFLPVVIATGPVINELSNQDATSLPSLQDSDVLVYITENLGEWIANPIEQLLTSMLLILWYAGIPILIFLAGLQKIDHSIYEAASIDGASPWDRFWKITLPSIQPLIGVAIIYIVVSMSLFVQPDGILDRTRIHMLVGAPDSAFWFGYGYAAAMAWLYFLLMVIIMAIFVGVMNARRREK